jgi:DMSO/TMAO reductase YedYZ molybdopterin-dependent catalytic subunit
MKPGPGPLFLTGRLRFRYPLEDDGRTPAWTKIRAARQGCSLMNKRTCSFLFIGVLTLAFLNGPLVGQEKKPTPLKPAEVREYHGEKLDSISQFEENSIKGPQRIDIAAYRLKVTGAVAKAASYRYQDVLARPSFAKVTTIHCVEGWDVKVLWEGILLKDLIAESAPRSAAVTVIFKSADGYSSSLPWEYIRRKNILLAYNMNAIPLPEERGYPFLVVAEDKWGYKWAKWVTEIELSTDPNYRGYWESRGYSNNGDQKGPIFEPKKK